MSLLKYRVLVITTFLILLFSVLFDFIWQKDLVEFVAEFAEALLDVGAIRSNFLKLFTVLMFIAAIYSFVGLWRLQSHARFVFLGLFGFIIPIYLLLGVSVQSGVSRILYDSGLLLSGALLSVIFTQPVKYYFDK